VLDQEILKTKNLELMSEKPEQVLSKKARQTTHKVLTVEINQKDQFFFKVPEGYLLTLVWLGGNTFVPKLYKL